ncbi:hypothetical protein N7510_010746 [Penicillium lagena]|uniref:uncharacterized protein n=1 Tax=Penicillium lagena TaxID=94218 RepID=UPI00253FC55D|nr:uncharacterized protein N7510_010746 [Penicillium lagena]KAJ5601212.1 hypothetical protein N7510_010746 [Penicillium lagena]
MPLVRQASTRSDGHSFSVPPVATSDVAIRPLSSKRHSTPSKLPPFYFLDFELYRRTVTEIPSAVTGIRPELQAFTEDIREQAQVYFRSIHPWIPFLSKKLFNERLLNPLAPPDAGITLLFACIKLVCSLPDGEDMCTDAYTIIKSSILEAEMAGILSFRILQAWILLCVYEFGHAIYPGAYFSISTCAKYATALGIDGNETNAQRRTFHWIDVEERTRARWVILILDR